MTNRNTWKPGPKFWVALMTAAVTVASAYNDIQWVAALSAGVGAALVYLVPNPPQSPTPPWKPYSGDSGH